MSNENERRVRLRAVDIAVNPPVVEERSMSPADVRALLDLHTLPAKDLAISVPCIDWMASNGLIDIDEHSSRLTKRGRALIAMILSTPLPREAFIDPRTGEEVQ